MTVQSLVRRELFPTTMFEVEVDFEPAAELREELLTAARTVPTVARGERTGWQSDGHLLSRSRHGEAIAALLLGAIQEALPHGGGETMLMAWANVLGRGDYFSPHSHAEAAWSGVWYLDANPEAGGVLEFRDPRGGAHSIESPLVLATDSDVLRVPAQSGRLIMFPSWLVHWVTPITSDEPRISIAFNAR